MKQVVSYGYIANVGIPISAPEPAPVLPISSRSSAYRKPCKGTKLPSQRPAPPHSRTSLHVSFPRKKMVHALFHATDTRLVDVECLGVVQVSTLSRRELNTKQQGCKIRPSDRESAFFSSSNCFAKRWDSGEPSCQALQFKANHSRIKRATNWLAPEERRWDHKMGPKPTPHSQHDPARDAHCILHVCRLHTNIANQPMLWDSL